jgi:glycosyltransferase involved in cell wall biosynthesis
VTAERMRVLRIIARMNVGGPALQVTELLRGMDPDRFDHRVLTGHVEPGEADYLALRAPDLPVERIDGLGRSVRPGADVRVLGSLVRRIRQFRPHIVHTHTAKAGVLGRLAARSCGVPAVVHTFHGHLLHGYFSPPVTRGVVQVERALARTSTRLIAVGAQVRDDLLAAGIGRPAQYAVVPPGLALPLSPPRAAARSALGLPQEGPVVMLVARLTPVKRPERFVAVAQDLAQRHPTATFAVCGEGDLLAELSTSAAGLGDRLRFLGWRGDVEAVYAASDLVVLTSDNEGMPVSLIEAALSGVPAVATQVGSVAEVVEDGVTGLLVPPTVPALVEGVDRLLRDPELRSRLAAAAAPRAEALFGQTRLVRDLERIYEEIAHAKRLARRRP